MRTNNHIIELKTCIDECTVSIAVFPHDWTAEVHGCIRTLSLPNQGSGGHRTIICSLPHLLTASSPNFGGLPRQTISSTSVQP